MLLPSKLRHSSSAPRLDSERPKESAGCSYEHGFDGLRIGLFFNAYLIRSAMAVPQFEDRD